MRGCAGESTLFPYTTLFRSLARGQRLPQDLRDRGVCADGQRQRADGAHQRRRVGVGVHRVAEGQRSEEHTSELQSQSNLVCRLLLEKKKLTIRALPGNPTL